MFLSKKRLLKILITAIVCLVVGNFCIAMYILFATMKVEAKALLVLGIIAYLLCILSVFFGRYAEGKAILINLGNTLVRKELKPAEFIKHYEALKNSTDLVIKKPSIEVLRLVTTAYYVLNDRENVLETVDEMLSVADEKKKAYVNLMKTSFLFSYGRKEEAESLFIETQQVKLDFMCKSLTDNILKTDRAMAMGDYKIAEAENLRLLEQTFPKLDNLGKLIVHYQLGEVYEKLNDNEKAVLHYQYCVNHGRETAIKQSAKAAIEKYSIQNVDKKG